MYFFTNLPISPAFEPASSSVQALFREEYVMTKRRERNARHQEALALRADAKLISFEAAARDALALRADARLISFEAGTIT